MLLSNYYYKMQLGEKWERLKKKKGHKSLMIKQDKN